MNIVILDDYQDAVRKLPSIQKIEHLNVKIYTNTARGTSQLSERLKDAHAIILNQSRTELPTFVLNRLSHLRLIIQVGNFEPCIDHDLCKKKGIELLNIPIPYEAIAEFAWAIIMSAMRRIPQYSTALRHGAWQQSGLKQLHMPPNFALGSALRGKTIGIWGLDDVSRKIAHYAQTFGMNVMIWEDEEGLSHARRLDFKCAVSREELFQKSDVLTLHAQPTPQNKHMIQLSDLLLMKPTSLFVNLMSAELVRTDALVAALNRGTPGLAAIDVFESEPIMQGHALLRMENTICTPHISGIEVESVAQAYNEAFDSILRLSETLKT